MDGEPLSLRLRREGDTGSSPTLHSLRDPAPPVSPAAAHVTLPSQAAHTQRTYVVPGAEATAAATASVHGDDVEMTNAPAAAAVTRWDDVKPQSPPRADDNPRPTAGDAQPASSAQEKSRYQVVDPVRLRELDEAFNRIPDGSSINEVDAVLLEENSRTYHSYKQGAYWLPNDPAEQDRLDLQHALFRLIANDTLAMAPVTKPRHVMDIATGTGIWAIEFALENPSSQVTGIDLTAIQPLGHGADNCSFQVDDAEDEWVGYPMFDYVHVRLVCTCFRDPGTVMRRIFANLTPGGWVEYQDYDMDFSQDNPDFDGLAVPRWCRLLIEGSAGLGRNLLVPRQYKQMMIDTGFVDVHENIVKVPVGPWMEDPHMKTTGLFMLRNVLDGLRGPSWKLLRAGGLTPEEVDELLADVKNELRNRNNRTYAWVYFVWGRKPIEGEAKRGNEDYILEAA